MKKLIILLLFVPIISFGQNRNLEETKKKISLTEERIKSDPTFYDKVGLISNDSKISNHIFFGLDLNEDWYSLTDYSHISYVLFKNNNPNEPIMYVEPNESSYGDIKNEDDWRIKEFKELGFIIELGFPTDYVNRDLKHIPTKLKASFSYADINNRYKFESYNKGRSLEQESGVKRLVDFMSLIGKYYGFLFKYGTSLNNLKQINSTSLFGRLILSTHPKGEINSGFFVWDGANYSIIISFNINNNKQIELIYSKLNDY
tara:strand:- start:2507 stop:3283 length:777 start_codon:yes stop_codon:yes gene_type:complete